MNRLVLLALLSGCAEYTLHARNQSTDTSTSTADVQVTTPPVSTTRPEIPPEPQACGVPVPNHVDLSHVVWSEPGVHFYVPGPNWAFASAFASRELEGLGTEMDLRLSPSYFLATALKESFAGCSDETVADPLHPEVQFPRTVLSDYDGCLQLESTTAWTEICRMYPNEIDCELVGHADVISSLDQGNTGRDNVETGMLAAAYYNTFAYAMIGNHGTNPDTWMASATDPHAMAKMVALIYNRGAWSGEIDFVLDGCAASNIEDCVSANSIAWDYVDAVGSYIADLEAAVDQEHCYNDDVHLSDVHDFLDALQPMFPGEDWSPIHVAAEEAFLWAALDVDPAPFQTVAPWVLEAIDIELKRDVHCPGAQLQQWYGGDCPAM